MPWTNVGSIRGPQGEQGPQGQQGIQGVPGNPGADGADGADGLDAWQSPNPTSGSGNYTINASLTTTNYAVSATGAIAIQVPTGTPTDHQRALIEIYASGASRSVSINASLGNATGATFPISVPSGKCGYFGLIYSSRASRWIVLSASVEA
jgi:hypothetical protein